MLKLAAEERRIVLTRNRELLKRKDLTFGWLVKSGMPEEQFQEVVRFFRLRDAIKPFTRCMACNGVLRKVDKQDIIDQLEPLTKIHYHTFHRRPDCSRIYWAGSHRERMEKFFRRCVPGQNNLF